MKLTMKMWKKRHNQLVQLLILLIFGVHSGESNSNNENDIVGLDPNPFLIHVKDESWTKRLEVNCEYDIMHIRIPIPDGIEFSGMVYPQGLSKNSSCLQEYNSVATIDYSLPFHSCNTMTVPGKEHEYINTIILEPHPKLVTGHGKGIHVRCKPSNNAGRPVVTMRILRDGKDLSGDHVQIGDPLLLNISIESKHKWPFIVTDCHVRDGLGWAEEVLVNSDGCTVDAELMGQFDYSGNAASVKFLAHKFPYSPSVYYSCSVRICKDCHPPACLPNGKNRNKRDISTLEDIPDPSALVDEQPATIEVYDGLYVNEVAENEAKRKADEAKREKKGNGSILCFSQRDFALGIAISGLILMIAVILLIFLLCLRSRRKGAKGSMSGGSSVYSGGYTNTAYSHTS